MKTKQITKKLLFNKETIANLNDPGMDNIKGGVSGLPCETQYTECTCFKTCTSNFPRICTTEGDMCP